MDSKKTFVLDTNVLLHNPYSLYSFEDNNVVIPAVVIEELDKFKKENSELGANARHVARLLDRLRERGDLNSGILLDNGSFLRIEMNFHNVVLNGSWQGSVNDNRILKVCIGLHEKGEKVYLITKDVFARIKADILGIIAQDFFTEQAPNYEEQYSGRLDVYTSKEKIDYFYSCQNLNPEDVSLYKYGRVLTAEDFVINQFLILHGEGNEKQTAVNTRPYLSLTNPFVMQF